MVRLRVKPASRGDERGKRRGGLLPTVIVVVTTLILFLSLFAIWVKRQALETDTWTETSSELLENEEIRDAIAGFLVTALYDNVDVEANRQLPPPVDRLAGRSRRACADWPTKPRTAPWRGPRVQTLWEEANRTAHERMRP